MKPPGSPGQIITIPVKRGKHTGRIRIRSDDAGAKTSETFHPGSYIEWWFFHGTFTGRACGCRHFMASLFRYDRLKTGSPDSVGYFLILSLLDPATGRTELVSRGEQAIVDRIFSPIRKRKSTNIDPRVLEGVIDELRTEGPVPPITLETEPVRLTGEPFSVFWKDFSVSQEEGQFRLCFDLPGTTTRCDLLLRPRSRRHEMHGIGATLTQPMAYATIPRLDLDGSLGDDDVHGEAWFDHQWGSACWFLTHPAGGRLNGWDWIAITGDDGSDWIFLIFHDMKTKRVIGKFSVMFTPENPPRIFRDFTATPVRLWESSRTHITYPVGWILNLAEISAEIVVSPVCDDQEIPVPGFMRAVWEGAATAQGSIGGHRFTGRARLELQGYGYIFDFGEFLGPDIRRVEEDIGSFFPQTISAARYGELAGAPHWLHEPAACTELIARPFWDLASRKKKLWRPVFGMLLLESLGVSMEEYRMLISVVPELTHTGTLIIDDIEDDAEFRRGDASIHSRYGLDVAINAANTLYFLPAGLYATHPRLTDRQRLAFYRITLNAFVRGHLGQTLDIFWTKNLTKRNLESWRADHLPEKILQMYEFKTASTAVVIAESCCILAGSGKATREAAMDLARSLGVAFQIMNDIRDLDDDQNDRRCSEDLSAGKLTYVIVRALERLSGPERKRLEQIICNRRLRKNPEHLAEGMRLVRKSGAAGACKKEAEEMVESGWNAFSSRIPASEHKLMLRLFSRGLVGDRKQKRGPA